MVVELTRANYKQFIGKNVKYEDVQKKSFNGIFHVTHLGGMYLFNDEKGYFTTKYFKKKYNKTRELYIDSISHLKYNKIIITILDNNTDWWFIN
jgi:hypothetical protein